MPENDYKLVNLKSGIKSFFIAILILLSILHAQAATIYGTVYSWETLEPLPKTIIFVNTTPEQQIVSEDGTYSINLSPGSYVLKASYYRNGDLELYAEMNITIEKEGSYNLDLILLPPLTDLNFSFEEPQEIDFYIGERESSSFPIIPLILIVPVILFAIYFAKGRWKKEANLEQKMEEERTIEKPDLSDLPEDLIEVLSVIEKEGGRITQKELRKRFGYSDAKMSLIIADLERRGIVEKIKRGRGNIIFLKK